jgi:dihydrofolate reductase
VAKLVLTMAMTLDGFFSGPGGELDWMVQAPDPEFSRDNVAFFDRFDRGFIGYPTASGMLPYWLSVANDPDAPKEARALAEALNRLRPILISDREEPVPWPNAELLVVQDDKQLADAVRKEKEKQGKDLGVPGGIRTARTLIRLGLVDEYIVTVHPVAIGSGKRIFTGTTSLDLISAKTYSSGVIRATYRPARLRRGAAGQHRRAAASHGQPQRRSGARVLVRPGGWQRERTACVVQPVGQYRVARVHRGVAG